MSPRERHHPTTYPVRRVLRVDPSAVNSSIKIAQLECGHAVQRTRRPNIGAGLVCDQCAQPPRPVPADRLDASAVDLLVGHVVSVADDDHFHVTLTFSNGRRVRILYETIAVIAEATP